jgi:hypothetical protein
MNVVYELAKTYFSNPEKAKELFQFLSNLDPVYQKPTRDLLSDELLKLRTNAAVLPFADRLDQDFARTEVARLACGFFDTHAQSFIGGLENRVKNEYPDWAANHISEFEKAQEVDPDITPAFRSPDAVLEYYLTQKKLPAMLLQVFESQGQRLSRSEAIEIIARLSSFPAIRTVVRANCYLLFICYAHKTTPGFDKIGDFRNLVEAAYCDSLICHDNQLTRISPWVNGNLRLVSLPEPSNNPAP